MTRIMGGGSCPLPIFQVPFFPPPPNPPPPPPKPPPPPGRSPPCSLFFPSPPPPDGTFFRSFFFFLPRAGRRTRGKEVRRGPCFLFLPSPGLYGSLRSFPFAIRFEQIRRDAKGVERSSWVCAPLLFFLASVHYGFFFFFFSFLAAVGKTKGIEHSDGCFPLEFFHCPVSLF